MAANPWAEAETANPWQEAPSKPKFVNPREVAFKAAKVGYSGLEPHEQAYIQSAFPMSSAANSGRSLADVTAEMDRNARGNREPTAGEMIFPGLHDVRARSVAEAAIGAGRPFMDQAGDAYRAFGGDLGGLPGKGMQATKTLAAALLGTIDSKEVAKNELNAVAGDFADRSDFWGDPAFGVGLFAPWVRAEQVGAALASRGLPALGRAITAYPRAAGIAVGAVQGAGQAVGLNAAHELLSPMERVQPAATDASGVDSPRVEAGLPLERWANPLQMALGAGAGGTLGFLGREAMQQGLMGTPGVRDFSEIAARVDRDVLPGLTELIDQPNTWGKADLLRNAANWKSEAQGVTGPMAEKLSPLANAERKRLTSGEADIFFDEQGTPFRTLPIQAQPFESEALQASGRVGGYGNALATGRETVEQGLTREDIYKGIVGKAMAEHLAGKGELSKLSTDQIATMTKKMLGTVPEMAPGAVYYPELPRYLAGFNNPAFDLYHSANRDAARELGRLGRKTVAPMYWENPSMTADEVAAMAGARGKYAKAALTDEWMDRANTARIEDRRNLVGKIAGLTEGLRWSGPMAVRKLGKALLDIQPAVSDVAVTSGRKKK